MSGRASRASKPFAETMLSHVTCHRHDSSVGRRSFARPACCMQHAHIPPPPGGASVRSVVGEVSEQRPFSQPSTPCSESNDVHRPAQPSMHAVSNRSVEWRHTWHTLASVLVLARSRSRSGPVPPERPQAHNRTAPVLDSWVMYCDLASTGRATVSRMCPWPVIVGWWGGGILIIWLCRASSLLSCAPRHIYTSRDSRWLQWQSARECGAPARRHHIQ